MDDWLIEGVLRPRGILIVASSEGLGKSHVRKEMAVRLTTCGGALFGHYPIPWTCSVLEIDEENGPTEEFRREEQVFAALGVGRDAAAQYWSASLLGLQLAEPTSQAQLRAEVGRIRPEVLMLDTGTSMVGDEWGVDLKTTMRFLRGLTVEFGCAVVVFVHLTKPSRDRPGVHGTKLSDVMGQWTRLADAVALMADLGGGRATWRMEKRVPPSEICIRRMDGLWVHEPGVGLASRHNEMRVLGAIADGHDNPDAIAASLGIARRTASGGIAKLRQDGLLERGHPYRITPDGYAALRVRAA